MKTKQNLKAMIQDRIKTISTQIEKFNSRDYLTYSSFDVYLDETYRYPTVGQYAFAPSRVLQALNSEAYFEMFKDWADKADKTKMPEYMQLQDELEQNLEWLEELK